MIRTTIYICLAPAMMVCMGLAAVGIAGFCVIGSWQDKLENVR